MRAIGYRRVSTAEQGDSGAGLEAQDSKIRAEVDHRQWELVAMLHDVASGKSMRKREDLERALAMLDAGRADALMVAKLDRLSRSMLDFAQLVARSKAGGWAIVALDLGVDTSTPNGKLIANVIMAMAEWEREIIGQRTKEGLAAVRARGTRVGRPSTVSHSAVQSIQTMHAGGLSLGKIARALNDAAVPTAQGGAKWYPATVKKILEREGSADDTAQVAFDVDV